MAKIRFMRTVDGALTADVHMVTPLGIRRASARKYPSGGTGELAKGDYRDVVLSLMDVVETARTGASKSGVE